MKKILFIITAFLATITPCNADTWDGTSSDTSWYSEGRMEYHIQNAAQLKGLANLVNNQSVTFDGATIYLDSNIDLNNQLWTPIGYRNIATQSVTFNGNFDAQGYTVSNLNITSSLLQYNSGGIFNIGFFGNSEGKISNLNLNGEITIGEGETLLLSNVYIGGIVGNGHDIDNCRCDVTFNFKPMQHSSGTPTLYVGIAAGVADNIKCVKTSGATRFSDTRFSNGYIGSVVGKAQYVDQCASDAYLAVPGVAATTYEIIVGGIAGNCVEVSNCIFTGTVSVYNHSMATDMGVLLAGICSGFGIEDISHSVFAPKEFKTNLGPQYYGMIAPLVSTQTSVIDSYYITGNESSREFYGTGLDDDFLKSGLNPGNLDRNIWEFKEGSYPSLKALKSNYTISIPVQDGRIGMDVAEGGSLTISVIPETGWSLQSLYIDGEDFTSLMNGNKYTFENVTSNHVVTAVFKDNTSGVQDVNVDTKKTLLEIKDGKLSFSGIGGNETVVIYGIDGKMIQRTTAEYLQSQTLGNGIYIIKIDDETYKISL